MTISTQPPQPRGAGFPARSASPAIRVAPTLGVAVAVAMVVSAIGAWLVLRSRDVVGPRTSGMLSHASLTPEGVRNDRRADAVTSPATGTLSGSDGSDPAEDVDNGRRAEKMLAFLDEYERQIDAAMARARESVVALEYTGGGGSGASGRRRIASGIAIDSHGDILSVRIDPPPAGAGSNSSSKSDAGRAASAASSPIVARDFLGRRHAARWVAADPQTGLTLLRIAPRAVRPIRRASEGPKLGSQVFVLGSPFGLGHSVNRGHVAGLDRVLELGSRQLGGLIQVQAPLFPGDSGAAVVDVRGSLLGLIRGGLAPPADPGEPEGAVSTPTEGRGDLTADGSGGEPDTEFGFAIPTTDALWIAQQLRTQGRVDRAYLGVGLEPMPVDESPTPVEEPPLASVSSSSASSAPATPGSPAGAWRGAQPTEPDALRPSPIDPELDPEPEPVPVAGARIREVVDGTPASRAGLRPGDRIVALDGQSIRSRNDLIDRLNRIPARKAIVLMVARDGDPKRSQFQVALRTGSRSGQPDPGASSAASATTRRDDASVPVTPTASRVEPSSSALPTPKAPTRSRPDHPAGSLNELKLSLPRAVVDRIEHLERRIEELEHLRAATKAAGPGPEVSPLPVSPGPPPAPEPKGDRTARTGSPH